MPTTVEVTLYSFDELSEKAQEKAIERLSDINIDCRWWDSTYEDAAAIGLEITEFDTYRGTIDGSLGYSLPGACRAIRDIHGKGCDTRKTARLYLDKYVQAFKQSDRDLCPEAGSDLWTDVEWFHEFANTEAAEAVKEEFRKALLEDYLSILRHEYDYQTDREAIVETICANDYLFTESGKLY